MVDFLIEQNAYWKSGNPAMEQARRNDEPRHEMRQQNERYR